MSTYKTPGVYIEEISLFPPSVAAVETAIPAFIGYTAKAEKEGESLKLKPTKIRSLLEFKDYFGADKIPESISAELDPSNNYAVKSISLTNTNRYFLFDSLRLFFDNGGGQCYIVSVDLFGNAPAAGDETTNVGLRAGIKALEKIDEPTMLVFPDACNMVTGDNDDPTFYSLQQMALAQCDKLKDRVAILDLKENIKGGQAAAVENFRNKIGSNYLKYAAAYSPWIYSSYVYDVDFSTITLSGLPVGTTAELLTSDAALNQLVKDYNKANKEYTALTGIVDKIRKASTATGTLDDNGKEPNIKAKFKVIKDAVDAADDEAEAKATFKALMDFSRASLLEFQKLSSSFVSQAMLNDLNSYAVSTDMWRGAALDLIVLDRNADVASLTGVDLSNLANVNALYPSINTTWLGVAAPKDVVRPVPPKDYGDSTVVAKIVALDVQTAFSKLETFANLLKNSTANYKQIAQNILYEVHPIIGNVVRNIKKELSKLPPSGAIAGVYARVDAARGVWKAPANESLLSVIEPVVNISHEEQADLNVDPVGGKSINVIRSFTGRGTIVWGARTLAGNDNEWRYVNVRRFFNFVEESVQKATIQFVFEPNDANTWIKIRAMIENFLTLQWRDGALAGAKPAEAFFVRIGLGQTMTAIDILEGRMNVEIGMAVVRPAEFIILKFSHKMQES